MREKDDEGTSKLPHPELIRSWRSFLIAHAEVTRICDERMRADGHTPIEIYDVLVSLEMADGWRLRMSELAERVLLSRSGLTRLVDRIEKKGWIKREECPSDGRGCYAVLTAEGQQAREIAGPNLYQTIYETWGKALRPYEDAKLVTFFEEVSKLSRQLR